MNMIDNSLFLMKIEHHYNLQRKLTPCIISIIELAVTYYKRILKTTSKYVTMRLMSSWQRLRGPEWVHNPDPHAWKLPYLRISDPPKSTSIFRTLY